MPAVRSVCRSCGAEVIWATNEKGRRQIINAYPDKDGNLLLSQQDDGTWLVEYVGRSRTSTRWTDHHATCPDVDRWRR